MLKLLALIPAAIAAFCAYLIYQKFALKRLMADTPTTKLGKLRKGFRESRGKVRAVERELTSPYTKRKCVYYSYSLKRRESYRDSEGNRKTRWVTDHTSTRSCPAIIEDNTGEAELNLTEAEKYIDGKTYNQNERHFSGSGLGSMIGNMLVEGEHYKHYEEVLEVGAKAYVLGSVVERRSGGFLFHKGRQGVFVVSNKSEQELSRHLSWNIGFAGFGLVAGIVAALAILIAVPAQI